MKIAPTELTIDNYLSQTDQSLQIEFSHLLNTQFFVGPLTCEEAIKEVVQYFQDTQPALLYKQNNQYFCVYP